jgi:hypothetical protein
MAALDDQVNDGPMTLSYLQVINLETRMLGTPQSAAKKHGNHRQVAKAAQILPAAV